MIFLYIRDFYFNDNIFPKLYTQLVSCPHFTFHSYKLSFSEINNSNAWYQTRSHLFSIIRSNSYQEGNIQGSEERRKDAEEDLQLVARKDKRNYLLNIIYHWGDLVFLRVAHRNGRKHRLLGVTSRLLVRVCGNYAGAWSTRNARNKLSIPRAKIRRLRYQASSDDNRHMSFPWLADKN